MISLILNNLSIYSHIFKNKLSNAAIELIVDIKPVITNIDTETHTEIIYDIPPKNTEEESKLQKEIIIFYYLDSLYYILPILL